mmetsp:Transcript_11397/g.24026  ORF Transcript_11397/g.24026 Transcript_11397/m.24026 type:complete len:105 (-) Transcript_11397:1241-1555(-)
MAQSDMTHCRLHISHEKMALEPARDQSNTAFIRKTNLQTFDLGYRPNSATFECLSCCGKLFEAPLSFRRSQRDGVITRRRFTALHFCPSALSFSFFRNMSEEVR